MKRKDLEVGKAYQTKGYSWRGGDYVIVLDTRPVSTQSKKRWVPNPAGDRPRQIEERTSPVLGHRPAMHGGGETYYLHEGSTYDQGGKSGVLVAYTSGISQWDADNILDGTRTVAESLDWRLDLIQLSAIATPVDNPYDDAVREVERFRASRQRQNEAAAAKASRERIAHAAVQQVNQYFQEPLVAHVAHDYERTHVTLYLEDFERLANKLVDFAEGKE